MALFLSGLPGQGRPTSTPALLQPPALLAGSIRPHRLFEFPSSDLEFSSAVTKRTLLHSQFVKDCEQIGMAGLKREVLAAVLIDAHLSDSKYGYVTRSIWCLAASVVFGFLYLLAIQF